MSDSRRGYTLAEVLVAGAIGLMMLGVVYQLVRLSRMAQSSAHQSYVLAEDVAVAFRMLQRELTETSLSSIDFRLQPKPLLTFLSSREENGLKVDTSGSPHWVKAVYYTLEPSEGTVGALVRRERPLEENGLPFPGAVHLPLPAQPGRPVAQNLLLPEYAVSMDQGPAEVKASPGAPGGFTVGFVRRDATGDTGDSISAINPCSRSDQQQPGWTTGCTGLAEVKLALLEKDSTTGQLGYLELKLRIRPAVP